MTISSYNDGNYRVVITNNPYSYTVGKSGAISPSSEAFLEVRGSPPGRDLSFPPSSGPMANGNISLRDPEFLPYQQIPLEHSQHGPPDYCTLRRQSRSVQFADPPNLERKISPVSKKC